MKITTIAWALALFAAGCFAVDGCQKEQARDAARRELAACRDSLRTLAIRAPFYPEFSQDAIIGRAIREARGTVLLPSATIHFAAPLQDSMFRMRVQRVAP